MTAASKSNGSSGCGCAGTPSYTTSGSPVATNGGCTCKECCDVCQDQGFARPHFFAGQLLTEEDLEQLTQYVVGKNRLHNQRLWGDGVVCGLDVKNHPCGGGQVIVEPGYALDCCGNDVVLPCSKTLDINAMVRKLREKMLGYDCGDPCDETTTSSDTVVVQGTAAGVAERVVINPKDPRPKEPLQQGRRYGLYLFYCEQKTDPVTPYSTAESCGSQTCVETRIREGFGFDLRCWKPPAGSADIGSRLCDCLKTAAESEALEGDAKLVERQAVLMRDGIQAMEKGAPAFQVETMSAAIEELKSALPTAANKTMDADMVRRLTEAVRSTASETARYYTTDAASRPTAKAAGVSTAQELLAQAAKVLATPEAATVTAQMSEIERSYSAAVAENASQVAKPLDVEASKRAEIVALAGGLVYTPDLEDKVAAAAGKATDLFAAAAEPPVKVVTMALKSKQTTALTIDRMREVLDTTETSASALRKSAGKCICGSANPPCQPCDDPGVLLAMIEVKDCEVIDICSLVRKWVITPVALRYWAPQVGLLGQYLALNCCEGLQNVYRGTDELKALEARMKNSTVVRGLARLIQPEIMAMVKACLIEGGRQARTPADVKQEAVQEIAEVQKRAQVRPKQPGK